MTDGFWSHPDFTLEMALYSFEWLQVVSLERTPDETVLIEHVASGDYADCNLYAVWWWTVTERKADTPFAIPAGYTKFQFRSYEVDENNYLVTLMTDPKEYDTVLPIGTVVRVYC